MNLVESVTNKDVKISEGEEYGLYHVRKVENKEYRVFRIEKVVNREAIMEHNDLRKIFKITCHSGNKKYKGKALIVHKKDEVPKVFKHRIARRAVSFEIIARFRDFIRTLIKE